MIGVYVGNINLHTIVFALCCVAVCLQMLFMLRPFLLQVCACVWVGWLVGRLVGWEHN